MGSLALVLLLLTSADGERVLGFSSLRVEPGVREAAMGGSGAAGAFGPQAVAWNPSANAGAVGFSATVHYTKWLLDTHQQSVFLARETPWFNVGLGAVSFSAGDFEYRVDPTEDPIGTFQPVEMTFYLNLARHIVDRVDAGITARYFYSRVMTDDATGLGVDAGLRYRPWRALSLGASVVDFGQTLTYRREVFWLPTRGRLGASYDFTPLDKLRLTASADGDYYFYSGEIDAVAGVEAAWNELLFVRAGYDFAGTGQRLSTGLGIRLGRLRFDYSLAPLLGELGLAHRLSLGFGY
jgi:hypothetical protein